MNKFAQVFYSFANKKVIDGCICKTCNEAKHCHFLASVNFTSILLVAFLYESVFQSFNDSLTVIFWQRGIGAKAARKMLVKLTTGQTFFCEEPSY